MAIFLVTITNHKVTVIIIYVLSKNFSFLKRIDKPDHIFQCKKRSLILSTHEYDDFERIIIIWEGKMKSKFIKFSRKELYDQVWSTPMIKLAKRYGLSDRGLSKICNKHDIPCPPRGYWAKLQAGKKVKKIPLPSTESTDVIKIEDSPVKKSEKEISENFIEENKIESIPVKKTLKGAHPLIKQTSYYLKTVSKKADEMLEPPKDKYLDITVSPGALRRGLLIMDAVIRVLESKGFPVVIENSRTQVKIFDINIKILLKEEYKTVPKKPKDHDLDYSYQFGYTSKYSAHSYDRFPSGILCLSIDEWTGGTQQKNWRDTKSAVLEDRLPKFMSGLIQIAATKSEETKQRKEEERLREERKRIFQQKVDEYSLEKERVSGLLEGSDNWNRAFVLRQYIAEVEKCLKNGDSISFIEGSAEAWIEWAKNQADRLDPLKDSRPSILDHAEELERASQRQSWW
jgi:molybdopterin converting factor small subunit